MRLTFSLVAALSLAAPVLAQEAVMPRCTWEGVAQKHRVNPFLLYAIAKQESSLRPNIIHPKNSDGSHDIGMMGINSWWLPKLSKFGINETTLLDPCVNLDVGAWILADNMKRYGNTWKALGAYNASSEEKRLIFARKVIQHLPAQAQ